MNLISLLSLISLYLISLLSLMSLVVNSLNVLKAVHHWFLAGQTIYERTGHGGRFPCLVQGINLRLFSSFDGLVRSCFLRCYSSVWLTGAPWSIVLHLFEGKTVSIPGFHDGRHPSCNGLVFIGYWLSKGVGEVLLRPRVDLFLDVHYFHGLTHF